VRLHGCGEGLDMKSPKYWRKSTSLKRINVIAKEWFDKSAGNSYFSVVATLNDEHVIKLPFQYGDHYLDMLANELVEHGWTMINIRRNCDHNIKILKVKIENCLKRDVIEWGEDK